MCEIIFGNLIAIVIHYEIIQHCVIFKLLLSCYSIEVSVGDTILASATFALRQKISNSESDITAKSWNCPAPVRKLRVLRSCVAKLLVIWRGLGVFYPCILVYIEAGWSSANDIWRNPVLCCLKEVCRSSLSRGAHSVTSNPQHWRAARQPAGMGTVKIPGFGSQTDAVQFWVFLPLRLSDLKWIT